MKELKPVVDQAADYYERYYADLEAQKLAAQRTPNLDSPASTFEEEEQKPSPQYLDALYASSRKRSQSGDDPGSRGSKALRSNTGTPVFSRSSSLGSSAELPLPTPDGDGTPAEALLSDFDDGLSKRTDDPIVYVGGQAMPFSEVTQEIADERMSSEEYTTWYELVMEQSS